MHSWYGIFFCDATPFPLKANHLLLSPIFSSSPFHWAFYFSFLTNAFFFFSFPAFAITPKQNSFILFSSSLPTPTLLILRPSSLSHFHSTLLSLSHTPWTLLIICCKLVLLPLEQWNGFVFFCPPKRANKHEASNALFWVQNWKPCDSSITLQRQRQSHKRKLCGGWWWCCV